MLASMAAASPARADESPNPPEHLTAYGLDWLNYIDPNDLPLTKYAVCIVDSGTLVTPDTPPDNPDGPIIERLSVDGGPGTPQGTTDEQLHGTRMAMAAIAPVNGWGTIGTTTWGRVISVRAMVNNELGFNADAYRMGLIRCLREQADFPVAAVSLSFGCDCDIPPEEAARLRDAIDSARDLGITVVAAAGNTAGGRPTLPGAFSGVMAVAGGDAAGRLCSYSSFDDRVAVVGPACPVQTANPLGGIPAADLSGGSSTSAAVTATLVAALRTLSPQATGPDIEGWIRTSSRIVDGHRVLDGDAAAREAGLGAVTDRARDRMSALATPAAVLTAAPSPGALTSAPQTQPVSPTSTPAVSSNTSPTPPPGATPDPTARGRPSRPSRLNAGLRRPVGVSAAIRHGRLTVAVERMPRHARLQIGVDLLGKHHSVVRHLGRTTTGRMLVLELPWKPDRVTVRFVTGREFGRKDSRPRILSRTPSGRFR